MLLTRFGPDAPTPTGTNDGEVNLFHALRPSNLLIYLEMLPQIARMRQVKRAPRTRPYCNQFGLWLRFFDQVDPCSRRRPRRRQSRGTQGSIAPLLRPHSGSATAPAREMTRGMRLIPFIGWPSQSGKQPRNSRTPPMIPTNPITWGRESKAIGGAARRPPLATPKNPKNRR